MFLPVDDDYRNLSLRLVAMLTTVSERYSFQYLFKIDDDAYLRVAKLLELLPSLPDERLYWGKFRAGTKIHSQPESKWYNPEYLVLNTHYPAYAMGAGYLITSDIVDWLLTSKLPLKIFKGGPEDAQMGIWLDGIDVHRIQGKQHIFDKNTLEDSHCSNSETVLLHGIRNDTHFLTCWYCEVYLNDICKSDFILYTKSEWQRLLRANLIEKQLKIRESITLKLVNFLSVFFLFLVFAFCFLATLLTKLQLV